MSASCMSATAFATLKGIAKHAQILHGIAHQSPLHQRQHQRATERRRKEERRRERKRQRTKGIKTLNK